MQLIVSVPDDFDKSTADVLNDVVTWVISEGSAYVSQWCEIDYGITELDDYNDFLEG